MEENMVFRCYPPGYTGSDPIKKLKELLSGGWTVKSVHACSDKKESGIINDYVLERPTKC